MHAVLLEDARFLQLGGEVEARLAAEVRQQRVRALLGDDLLETRDVERLDVDGISRIGVGHDGGRVAVHEHDLVAELAQRFARLRARIVELARLADDDGAGADDEHLMDIVAFWHGELP